MEKTLATKYSNSRVCISALNAHIALVISQVLYLDTPAKVERIITRVPHLRLFDFVTTEDNQFLGMILGQNHIGELFAEGTGASGDKNALVMPVHLWSLILS